MSPLREEIKQRRPFRSRGHEGVVSLLLTADRLRRDLAQVVEPHGLTLQQYNVLRILRGAGSQGLPTLDVADRMIEQTPGITRLLDRLEGKSLVRRERCAKDRRRVWVAITPGGLRLLATLDGPMSRADDALLERLGARRAVTLIRLLEAARKSEAPRAPDTRSFDQRRQDK
jgi:MarR family transcriptional regulator, organic hydroperoxide resistance regulator